MVRRSTGGVERRERRARAGDAVRAWRHHIASHEDLVGPKSRDRYAETRGGSCATPHATVGASEARVEQALEFAEREVGDADLSDLRDHDEPLPRDVERVRQLDIAGEDQHELVARAAGVDLPICSAVAALLAGSTTLVQAITGLLARPQRDE